MAWVYERYSQAANSSSGCVSFMTEKSRSPIFDYAYDRFHQDRYGKDFWHVRVQAKEDASATAQRQTMTAALLAYWHQVACFRSAGGKQAAAALGLQVAAPPLAERVLADCFGWQEGDKLVLRLIKSASGELGLGLLRGDTFHYYGVVNVGDAAGLKKALEDAMLPVEDDAMSGSLFASLDAPGSGLNVLIGSRRFAEGWDNFRASSLTLLRLGQGEGSLIIQMFGRVGKVCRRGR
jgi:hypothetical protein